MEDQILQPETPVSPPPLSPDPPMTQPKHIGFRLARIFVYLVLFVAGIGIGVLMSRDDTRALLHSYLPSVLSSPSPTPTQVTRRIPDSYPTPTPDETVSWILFTAADGTYSFKYPIGWLLQAMDSDTVFLTNAKKTVGIIISGKQYPYGSSGDLNSTNNGTNIDVMIVGQKISAKEMIFSNSAYVDFAVNNPREIHVLFGTGYPVAPVGDSNKSLSDYQSSRELILKILSTFKFITPQATQKNYSNAFYGISLQYPGDFTLDTQNSTGAGDIPSTLFAMEKNNTFSGRHLTTRYVFLLQNIPNLTTTNACYRTSAGNIPLSKNKTINGKLIYFSDPITGAAAGTHNTTVEYRVFHKNTCFGIETTFFESSDWNDPTDMDLASSDKAKAYSLFDQIINSLSFAGGTP